MAKVEIITRAFNRLEYTVKCVTGIKEKAGIDDYEHIIIDQNSTDGTGAWLKSLVKEGYYKIKPIFNTENTGDAGGMTDGINVIGEDCQYIMQFDNDCEPLKASFLKRLVFFMDNNPDCGAIMLKRMNVNNILPVENRFYKDGLHLGTIPEPKNYTCCTILRFELVKKLNPEMTGDKIAWVQTVTRRMMKEDVNVYKCLNVSVNHIDGASLQYKKYPNYYKSKTTKGSNYTAVNYE